MEKSPTSNFEKEREFKSKEEAVTAFFIENDVNKLSFDTPEEAKLHVELINKKYGDIAFIAEDRSSFVIKFKVSHLGEGFEEYSPENGKNGRESDLEKAA